MRGTMGAMPSLLIEMGFLSNPAEEKLLRSTALQKSVAEAVFRGIRTFIHRYDSQLSSHP
jgi:N-acetylmuramoyl-L-alanine amidase